MLTRFIRATFGAVVAVVVGTAPTWAADDIAAKVATCGACHGENGIPTDPKIIPIIWGQQQSYLMKQLHDYRSGDRDNPIMSAIAKDIPQEDLRKIAAYFAAKPWPAHAAAASAQLPQGASQCQPCHQPKFDGGMPAPRLAGLSYDYIAAQMNAFADGSRTNNLDMPKFMQMLSPAQRDAIAHYLSSL